MATSGEHGDEEFDRVNNILPGYVFEIFSFMLLQKYINKELQKNFIL